MALRCRSERKLSASDFPLRTASLHIAISRIKKNATKKKDNGTRSLQIGVIFDEILYPTAKAAINSSFHLIKTEIRRTRHEHFRISLLFVFPFGVTSTVV